MLENSYKIEQVLLEIIYTVTNDDMAKKIIDLLTILNEFGYIDVDTLIINEMLGNDLETDEMGQFIKSKLLKVSIEVLKSLGIVLEHDIRLQTVINILLTLYTINNIEPGLKEPLLSILEDNEKNNIEKIALIVSIHSTSQYVETYESIDAVTDLFISTYVHKLHNTLDLEIDSDIDGFEEDFKLMTDIISIDPLMTSTLVVRSLMSGVEISSNMGDHLDLLVTTLDSVESDPRVFAANVATLLYMCNDTKDDILNGYVTYVEDNLLSDLELDVIGKVTKHVKEYSYKLEQIKR
jgi:hypothetical protein